MVATWEKVDFDLWYSDVVFLFLKNKEGVADRQSCEWYWHTGHSPAQTYYKLSTKEKANDVQAE